MTLRRLFSRHAVTNISKVNGRALSSHSSGYRCVANAATNASPLLHSPGSYHPLSSLNEPKNPKFYMPFVRFIHSLQGVSLGDSSHDLDCDSEADTTMNEFLSRFVWIMRKKLKEAYPGLDKNTVDGMLLIIVGKVVSEMEKGGLGQMSGVDPSLDFSEDLWRVVWDVSHVVLRDMEREKKKEKMKSFLQSEEVKEKYRFAGEIGIRGDMLRELRFKWAREKMEESEFYEGLERQWKEGAQREAQQQDQSEKSTVGVEGVGDNNNADEGKQKIVSLPKRHGKIKYNIYGLDLSDSKWAEVADKIHESGEILWPKEPKPLTGKCKIVTDKILSLQEGDDPTQLIGEWTELVQPSRVDWISLLERLKDHNSHLYFKVAELLLVEKSFQANIRDYSRLIDSLANENRLEAAERIIKKMNESGILPDIIMSSSLVQMYCKSGNLDQAKEAFGRLKAHGFQPDLKVYHSMIMAYINAGQPRLAESLAGEITYANAGQPRLGESLAGETETSDTKLIKEIYRALLQSYAQRGDLNGADRISTAMEFCGLQPSLESCTLMVEACERANEPDRARGKFDQIKKLGLKPDDKCIAHMLAAYENGNFLDDSLSLLLELEKDGVEPGVAAYTVMVDWLIKLGLYDEAEQMLDKIAELGEAPPVKLHTSLCDMYIKSGSEKKALQFLGVLESRFEQLESGDFERIIGSLISGGFMQDAQRMHRLMEGRGFGLQSEDLKIKLMASESLGKSNKSNKSSLLKDK